VVVPDASNLSGRRMSNLRATAMLGSVQCALSVFEKGEGIDFYKYSLCIKVAGQPTVGAMERACASSSQDRRSIFFKVVGSPGESIALGMDADCNITAARRSYRPMLFPGIEKSPGTILAGHPEHIVSCVPMSRRFELV
jgi:hypothetical protein